MKLFEAARASFDHWRAMRELRSLEREGRQGAYWEFKNLVIEADEVFERDLRARAIEIWQRGYAKFPNEAVKSESVLELLLKMELYDDAEQLTQKGRKQYPNDARFLEGLTQISYKRGDREEALRRCAVLRKHAPRSVKGYWLAAATLSELGRDDEAEALLGRGLKAMPDDVGLRIEFARLADRRGDLDASLQRWTEVFEVYGHLAGVVGMAGTLAKLGRFDEAEQALGKVLYKAGNQITVWIGYAHIAEQRNDQDEAAKRWRTVRDRFPLHPIGYLHGLKCLLDAGRLEEAEEILRAGIDQCPSDPGLLVEYASLAHRRGDWTQAAQRWAAVRHRFPNEQVGYTRGSEALEALGEAAEARRVRLSGSAGVPG